MNVGDTLQWALPEEPSPGTVVEDPGKLWALMWERNSWSTPIGDWMPYPNPGNKIRTLHTWAMVLYFNGGSVVVHSGEMAGTTLSWRLPDEPPFASVVQLDNGARYMRRKGSRPMDGVAWRMVDTINRLVNQRMPTAAMDWERLVFQANGSLIVTKLGG